MSSDVDPDAAVDRRTGPSSAAPSGVQVQTRDDVRRLFMSQSQELAQQEDMLAMGNSNLIAPPAALPPQTPAPQQASLAVVRDFM